MQQKEALGYLFNISSRFYRRAVDQALEKYDLTASQCAVVRMLLHQGEMTQAEIADQFSSDRATIGSVIMKLHEKKFLKKTLSDSDRRAYVVSLTPKARKIADEIDRISEDVAKKALGGLSKDEIQHLYKVLNQIICNLS